MELTATAITSLIITALSKMSEPIIKLAYEDLKSALSSLFIDEKEALQLPLSKVESGEEAWVSALENSLSKYEKRYSEEINTAFQKLQVLLEKESSTSNNGINVKSGNDTYVSQQSIQSVSGEKNKIVGQVIKKK